MKQEVIKLENKYTKFNSRRWIISIWSMVLISVIVVWSLAIKCEMFGTLALTLVAIPTSFVSLESIKKWKGEKDDKGKVADSQ